MRPGPVGRAVRGGLTRRRVQVIVIGLVMMASTAASILALALVADSNAPFDRAFGSQRGADVTASLDRARTSPAQLAATRRLPGVAAAAGPFAETSATLRLQSGSGPLGIDVTVPQLTLVGRASPGGPVDDVILQAGHWPTGPGQIVLDDNPQGNVPVGLAPGAQAVAVGLPGKPRLTIVGIASSVTYTADGWVVPAEIARLTARGTTPGTQMLYRFVDAGSDAAIRADIGVLGRALPAGAITATASYLPVKAAEESGIAPFAPFVVAFGIIGLVMSVLIVINVITGAVVAGYWRIGVLKSIGFTPGQVVAAYAAQALVPAAAGALAGVVLGSLLSGVLLTRAANVYHVGILGVPAWVNLGVPVTMLVVVGIAALIPATRAGRLSAIQAIAAGRAPRQGGGYAAHRMLGRLPLPRPVTIGLAAPFARPARTAVMLISVLLGAAAVTFGVGLSASFEQVATGLSLSSTDQVQVSLPLPPPPGMGPGTRIKAAGQAQSAGPASTAGPGGGPLVNVPTAATARRTITAALRRQPGTLHYVAESDEQVSVPGLAQQVQVTAYQGSPAWLGYAMISGRWYSGPGQVDVPTYFLTVTGKTVGDMISFSYGGRQVTARIVGEVFDTDNSGLAMLTSTQTLTGNGRSSAPPNQYDVQLRPGTEAAAYVRSLQSALGQAYPVNQSQAGQGLPIILGLISLLTLLLAIVAGLGVLNTVVLQTREKVHDLGIFKAIGMAPRQTIAMVMCWVAGVGLIAGLVAVPAGIALQHYLVPIMGAAAGTGIPAVVLDVYGPADIAVLALAGAVIAIAGAIAPASWAAAAKTSSALRAE
jgi:putative ABC transport system permease protein